MASLKLLVLDFARAYITRWSESPSYGEIAAALGCGRSTARDAVRSLVAEGLLLRRGRHRGLVLPDQREMAVRLLRTLGWSVDEDIEHAVLPLVAEGPGRANPTLLPPPALRYGPDRAGAEVTGGDDGDEQGCA